MGLLLLPVVAAGHGQLEGAPLSVAERLRLVHATFNHEVEPQAWLTTVAVVMALLALWALYRMAVLRDRRHGYRAPRRRLSPGRPPRA